MSFGRARVRRPDDWPSSHVRARADLSEQLDLPLDPSEANWLESHLEACPDCRAIAGAYEAQRLELRGLRDRIPLPPRDLWARTAAAIESESRFRDGRDRTTGWRDRRALVPSVLLAAALVVVVAVGTLTSSQHPVGDAAAGPSSQVALGSGPASNTPGRTSAGPTPLAVAQKIEYLSRGSDGTFSIKVRKVDQVCPPTSTQPCDTNAPIAGHAVNVNRDASTVFGSPDEARLIVVNDPTSANSGTISVVPLESAVPATTPTPTPSIAPTLVPASIAPPVTPTPPSATTIPPSATPTPTVRPTPSIGPVSPPPPPTPPPSAAPPASPSPSVAVTPSPSGGPLEIASDVALVGESAAYSPTGHWFAFTARPIDGSLGPDIFVWKVGDALATRITSDHRSVFGSWSGEVLVGSTIVETTKGVGAAAKTDLEPASFLLDPATSALTALPQAGQAWRPAVDPSGRLAVYWAGTVRATTVPGFAPDAGRLVLGDWAAATSAPTDGPLPTTLNGDQAAARHETTIAAGRMDDWDARWDTSGTHLAIWIADQENPAVGRLSLYTVDSFDGKIDLKTPLLDAKVATAGYSISDGQLVWAEPSGDGSTTDGKIQLLAWTDEGVGTVETVTGPVIVIR